MQLTETFAEQAAVAVEHARLQQELGRLAVLEDRERIAKELHDGVIQALFAVGLGLQGSATLARDPDLQRRIGGAVEELDRVIGDLRNYIFGLRPGILADRQLDQGLRRLAEELEHKAGVVTVVEVDPRAAVALTGVAAECAAGPRGRVQCQPPRSGHHLPGFASHPGEGTRVRVELPRP